jgi:hypothetical protein
MDIVCRSAGLDWSLCYGIVLLSTPERLWPDAPRKFRELSEKELEEARTLVERLNSDVMDERDGASAELVRLGAGVLPVLEANTHRSEAEVATRCQAMAAELRRPPRQATFRVPAAERQREKDVKAIARLREHQTCMSIQGLGLAQCFKFLVGQVKGVDVAIADGVGQKRVSFHTRGITLWAILSILCHVHDCDFMFAPGGILIDTRERIEKKVAQE